MVSTSDVVRALCLVGLSCWQGAAAQQACNGAASSLPSARFQDNGDGTVTDYRIDGIEVDCKYSMNAAWSLPPEVMGHLALLVTASDEKSTWRAGLLRVELPLLNIGRNRDGKGTLSLVGRESIDWLWEFAMPLAPNLFLTLPSSVREQIFHTTELGKRDSGQARVNVLFRLVQRRIVRRAELATVARQDDFMKRARGNGGARTALKPEGILILGHSRDDPFVAQRLGLPVPTLGELVSARVTPAEHYFSGAAARIEGMLWRLASKSDPIVAAPDLR